MNRKRAFTLIEVLVIVAILGVLAINAIPTFINYFRKAKTTEATEGLDKLKKGAEQYFHRQPGNLPGTSPVLVDPSPEPEEIVKIVPLALDLKDSPGIGPTTPEGSVEEIEDRDEQPEPTEPESQEPELTREDLEGMIDENELRREFRDRGKLSDAFRDVGGGGARR